LGFELAAGAKEPDSGKTGILEDDSLISARAFSQNPKPKTQNPKLKTQNLLAAGN
jgi:hypothetical protein